MDSCDLLWMQAGLKIPSTASECTGYSEFMKPFRIKKWTGRSFINLGLFLVGVLILAPAAFADCPEGGSIGTSQSGKGKATDCFQLKEKTCDPKKTFITVDSEPHGLAVWISGQKRGMTPIKIRLAPEEIGRPLEVTLRKDGYGSFSRKVNIRPCENRHLGPIRIGPINPSS